MLYQKSAPIRFIPTAEEIFEGEKHQQKIWLLLKVIFDIFGMHDVNRLTPYILKWISMSLQYFGPQMKLKTEAVNVNVNMAISKPQQPNQSNDNYRT